MGLAGGLIVRSATAGRAYDAASTAYDRESMMVLSEIVPGLNNAAAATCGSQSCLGSFEMYDYKTAPTDDPDVARTTNFKPAYRLVNGKAYPQIPSITAAANDRVLLRYVNAGSEQATTTMLGLGGTMVGRGASLLATPFGFVAETFPAGSTGDAIVTVPASASSGDRFPIYDRHLGLFNGAAARTRRPHPLHRGSLSHGCRSSQARAADRGSAPARPGGRRGAGDRRPAPADRQPRGREAEAAAAAAGRLAGRAPAGRGRAHHPRRRVG